MTESPLAIAADVLIDDWGLVRLHVGFFRDREIARGRESHRVSPVERHRDDVRIDPGLDDEVVLEEAFVAVVNEVHAGVDVLVRDATEVGDSLPPLRGRACKKPSSINCK